MNLSPSLGTPVSTVRGASTPVGKPEPLAPMKRKRGGQPGPRKSRDDCVTVCGAALLPRDWAWLKAQPGGVSATLRRLDEAARTAEQPTELKDSRQVPRAGCGA